jgi:hypothetical protein
MTQGGHPKDFDEEDTCLLEQAVEKLVRVGQQVGVTPEEIGKSITNKCIRVVHQPQRSPKTGH